MNINVFERAETLYNSINEAMAEVQSLKRVAYDSFKEVQIGTCTLFTTTELSKQIIDTIIAYKEKQIEQWKQEFEKL